MECPIVRFQDTDTIINYDYLHITRLFIATWCHELKLTAWISYGMLPKGNKE